MTIEEDPELTTFTEYTKIHMFIERFLLKNEELRAHSSFYTTEDKAAKEN